MKSWLVSAIFGLGMAGPAGADIIFSDLGPGGSYQSSSGWTVYGPTAPIKEDRACPFVPLQSYTLDSIQAAFTWSSGVNAGDLYLMSDSGGVPGAILESFHLENLPAFGASNTELATATSTLHPLLSAGTQYWVAVSANDNSFLSFNWNDLNETGLASRDNSGTWFFSSLSPAGAFDVMGTLVAVPEPAALTLASLSAAAILTRLRRRN